MAWSDASLRAATAVLVLVGLTAAVVVAYWRDGLAAAEGLYGLVQGLILGAFGWLYGSHAAERAERAAAEAHAAEIRVVGGAEAAEKEIARLERDLRLARLALQAALAMPRTEDKVDEELRRLESRDDADGQQDAS